MYKSHVIQFFGTQSEIARVLGCSEAAVSLWGAVIPKGRAYELKSITGGKLKVDLSLYPKKASVA